MKKRRNVGLAPGGGARGLVHIGVLEVLKQKKIPIEYLLHTSIPQSCDYFTIEHVRTVIYDLTRVNISKSNSGGKST